MRGTLRSTDRARATSAGSGELWAAVSRAVTAIAQATRIVRGRIIRSSSSSVSVRAAVCVDEALFHAAADGRAEAGLPDLRFRQHRERGVVRLVPDDARGGDGPPG